MPGSTLGKLTITERYGATAGDPPVRAAMSILRRAATGSIAVCLAAAAMAAPPRTAGAAMLAGVRLPPALDTQDGTLQLVSCGVRDTLWIDHYAAGLYVPAGGTPQAVRDPEKPAAVRLQIIDARYLPGNIPAKWRHTLAHELRREPMIRVRSAYDHLQDGDVVTFTYMPGDGVAMRVNGHLVMHEPGHKLIDSILQAWAGHDGVSGKLHRLELEHPCERR